MNTVEEFSTYIKKHKASKKATRLFLDLETLTYNKAEGRKNPSKYKSILYSLCVGWLDDEEGGLVHRVAFPSWYEFEKAVEKGLTYRGMLIARQKIEIVFHNGNKFDNHFIEHAMKFHHKETEVRNIHLTNAVDNSNTCKLGELVKGKPLDRDNIILEKRVKSATSLELDAFYNNVHYITIDNAPKTGSSIRELGKKLLALGVIEEEQLKTEFEYDVFDLEEDMSDVEAYLYAKQCFLSLTDKQLVYIENDVIILGKSVYYYSDLYPDFDWEKRTKTVNIKEKYTTNPVANWQLLKQYQKEGSKYNSSFRYTDFAFHGMNLYDFFKEFFKGGLNFYNDKYVAKLIKESMFSVDINSSFPYVMFAEKIPTFIVEAESYKQPTPIFIDTSDKNYYYQYAVDMKVFNDEILSRIKSRVIRQMLVKYYSSSSSEKYINTYTFKMIEKIAGIKIETLPVNAYVKHRCMYFGSRETLAEFYRIKTQGKQKFRIEMIDDSPLNIIVTDEPNEEQLTEEGIAISKVNMNGLYGLPALKSHFNLFRLMEDNRTLFNMPNGYENKERNIVFSSFVTSVALYNLLSPFEYLTAEEIDENFVYCDTDSLYMKKAIFHKMPADMFHDMNLGKWDIENHEITDFFVLNHKKYCYYSKDIKKGKEKGIQVRCGGVRLESFRTEGVTFEEFVEHQFSKGCQIKTLRSIRNQIGTITLYDGYTELDAGTAYPIYFTPILIKARKAILEKAQAEQLENMESFENEDMLYIESQFGSFSMKDIYPSQVGTKYKQPMYDCIKEQKQLENLVISC